MLKYNLYDHITYDEDEPTLHIILETDIFKEIRIVMHKGNELNQQITHFPILVELVEGKIEFYVAGKLNTLVKGDLISLRGRILHDIVALEKSIIRLTMTKYDNCQIYNPIFYN